MSTSGPGGRARGDGGDPPESGTPTEAARPVASDDQHEQRGPAPVGPDEGDKEGSAHGDAARADPGSSEVRDVETAGQSVEADEAVGEDVTVAAVAAQRDEYLDALRRLQADFENYKKRMIKQQTEHLERAAEGLVLKLLPVLDAVDLAVAHAEDSPEAKVVAPIASSLFDVLAKEGLERIEPLGQRFDPNLHDAVAHEPPDPSEPDEERGGAGPGGGPADDEPQVSDVMRAGYRWKGRVVRPAMVKVKG